MTRNQEPKVGTRLGSKKGTTLRITVLTLWKKWGAKKWAFTFRPCRGQGRPGRAVDPLGFGAVSATEEGRRAREQRREARSSRSVSGSCLGRSLSFSLSPPASSCCEKFCTRRRRFGLEVLLGFFFRGKWKCREQWKQEGGGDGRR